MLILATNRPSDLDTAVLSRMDYQIYLGPPIESVRLEILQRNVEKFFSNDPFFSPEYVEALNKKLEGFTGRDVFKLCNKLIQARSETDTNELNKELVDRILEQHIHSRQLIQEETMLTASAP
jgi:SpoVK/Ycf46/Vps4 family AAA+-type ATPase